MATERRPYRFNYGDGVRVTGGAFENFEGRIASEAEAKQAAKQVETSGSEDDGIWVLLNLFGRVVAVRVQPDFLQPFPGHTF